MRFGVPDKYYVSFNKIEDKFKTTTSLEAGETLEFVFRDFINNYPALISNRVIKFKSFVISNHINTLFIELVPYWFNYKTKDIQSVFFTNDSVDNYELLLDDGYVIIYKFIIKLNDEDFSAIDYINYLDLSNTFGLFGGFQYLPIKGIKPVFNFGFTDDEDVVLMGLPFTNLNTYFNSGDFINFELEVRNDTYCIINKSNLISFLTKPFLVKQFNPVASINLECDNLYHLREYEKTRISSRDTASMNKYINSQDYIFNQTDPNNANTDYEIAKLVYDDDIRNLHKITLFSNKYDAELIDNKYTIDIIKNQYYQDDMVFVAKLKPLLSKHILDISVYTDILSSYLTSNLNESDTQLFGIRGDLVTFNPDTIFKFYNVGSEDSGSTVTDFDSAILPLNLIDKLLCLNLSYDTTLDFVPVGSNFRLSNSPQLYKLINRSFQNNLALIEDESGNRTTVDRYSSVVIENVCRKYDEDGFLLSQNQNIINLRLLITRLSLQRHFWNDIELEIIKSHFSRFYSYINYNNNKIYFPYINNYNLIRNATSDVGIWCSNTQYDIFNTYPHFYYAQSALPVLPVDTTNIPKSLYRYPDSIKIKLAFDYLTMGREHTLNLTDTDSFTFYTRFVANYETKIPIKVPVSVLIDNSYYEQQSLTRNVILNIQLLTYHKLQLTIKIELLPNERLNSTLGKLEGVTCTSGCHHGNILCNGANIIQKCYPVVKEPTGQGVPDCDDPTIIIPFYKYKVLFPGNLGYTTVATEGSVFGCDKVIFYDTAISNIRYIDDTQACEFYEEPLGKEYICDSDWYLVIEYPLFGDYFYRVYSTLGKTCLSYTRLQVENFSSGQVIENFKEILATPSECNYSSGPLGFGNIIRYKQVWNADLNQYDVCYLTGVDVPNLVDIEEYIWNE